MIAIEAKTLTADVRDSADPANGLRKTWHAVGRCAADLQIAAERVAIVDNMVDSSWFRERCDDDGVVARAASGITVGRPATVLWSVLLQKMRRRLEKSSTVAYVSVARSTKTLRKRRTVE